MTSLCLRFHPSRFRAVVAAAALMAVGFGVREAGASTYVLESFEGGTWPPAGWQVEQITNSTTLRLTTASSAPPGYTAFSGSYFACFNSYSSSGGVVRLRRSSPLNTVGFTNLVVSFAWLESSLYWLNDDRLDVEWSTNGTTWTSAATIHRYNAVQGWKSRNVTLPVDALGRTNLYFGLKFTSVYGNDCYVDDIRLTDTPLRSPTGMINYQGRISVDGTNFDGTGRFWFHLLSVNGVLVWSSGASGVQVDVSKGLYSILLGDSTIPDMEPFPEGMFTTPYLRLRVAFDGGSGAQVLSPDQWIGSAGYALMAARANAAGLVGTIPDARLSTNVALLSGGAVFSGAVSALQFSGNGAGITNLATASLADNSVTPAKLAQDAAGLARVSDGHMAWSGSQVDVEAEMRLNKYDLFLREGTDRNHGLGWYGSSKLFGGINVDGPVAYGWSGGGLGSVNPSNQLALQWMNTGTVLVDPHGNNAGNLGGYALVFGHSSGEGMASQRTAGGNQFGLDFYTDYTQRMSISKSGSVGIGTSTPTNTLDVVGAVSADDIGSHGTNTFQMKVNNLQRLRLDASGNVVGGGTGNSVKPGVSSAVVGGGLGHTLYAGSDGAAIGGGDHNTVSNAPYAVIPGGSRAVANHHGQMAFAGGRFSVDGDAQTSVYVLRNKTQGTSGYSLYLDGSSEGKPLTIPAGARWVFDILLIASTASGTTDAWQIRGVIKNVGGSTSFVGTPSVTTLGADAIGWSAGVAADDATDTLRINVAGSGTDWVSWVATVRTVEVIPQ